MKTQRVTRVVDAFGAQQRMIIHMECGHTDSVSLRDVQAMSSEELRIFNARDTWDCPHCPDPPRVRTVRELRMAAEYDSLSD